MDSHCGSIGEWEVSRERSTSVRAKAELSFRRLILRRQKGDPLGIGSGRRRWNMIGMWSEMFRGEVGYRWREEMHAEYCEDFLTKHLSSLAVYLPLRCMKVWGEF